MSDQDVEKLVRSDSTWNRPTWPLGKHIDNKPQFKESISFENIERFKFLDSSKSFEDLFKEKLHVIRRPQPDDYQIKEAAELIKK